ncbi:MAG: 3'-5' exonuclease, partial [Candidatus Gracilibacteria bacterium]
MGPFIVLDIETTGRDPGRDHIIEVAAIKWEDFKITGRFERLVNPRVPIPYEITMLTGITNEMVKDAPIFSEMQKELFEFTGDLPIVGHNISFDMSFLRIHKNDMKNAEIDTLALAKILLRKESSYALEVLMRTHNLQLRTSHRAMMDTETTVDFLEFLLGKISEIDESLWPQIEGILQKSDWPGKDIFEKPKKKGVSKKAKGKTEKTSEKKSGNALNDLRTAPLSHGCLWEKSSTDALLNGEKILLESPGEIPFGSFKG